MKPTEEHPQTEAALSLLAAMASTLPEQARTAFLDGARELLRQKLQKTVEKPIPKSA